MSIQGPNRMLRNLLLIASLMLVGENAMSLEQPSYSVVYADDDVEYRQYEPYLVAQTIIEDVEDYKAAGNEGFRRLFRYITGSNKTDDEIAMTAPVQQSSTSEKIAMTAPVQQSSAAGDRRVSFMLPKKYTMETAPVPTDPRVSVESVPGRLMAVRLYSGRWTERNYNKQRSRLLDSVAAARVETIGEAESALYNPPYTPPFMRRNEVMVQVSSIPATSPENVALAVSQGAY